jgi:GNAT superfamily N-acetyltransferase
VLSSRDLGLRVVVRRRVDGGLTDVVGHLLAYDERAVSVLRPSGEVVDVEPAAVTAAKVVPTAPTRPGWTVPQLSAAELQRVCWAGWPARDVEMLGEWALRAHDGVTGRANSAMTVGDPGRPVAGALGEVEAWYAARGLPALVQTPLADPVDVQLRGLGWRQLHVTIVQVAPVGPVLSRLPSGEPGGLRSVVAAEPSTDWLSLMHDLDPERRESHLAILTGPDRVGFVTTYDGDEPVGIGRVSIEGTWAGVTSVDVAPGRRRSGIGTVVMRELLAWAGDKGAVASYLQVRALNAAALRLYAALGYVTHHPYGYRVPPGT